MTNSYSHTAQPNDHLPNKAIKRIGIISLVTGAAVLTGWIFNLKNLESVIPGLVTMKVNTSICFVLLGVALIVKNGQQSRWSNSIYRALLLFVFITGCITLLEYQLHFDAHIDQLFVPDNQSASVHFPFPGRMGYNTAVSFILLGLGLLGLSARPGKFHTIFQYLLHAVTVISGIAIMGYVYGVSMLYNFSYVSSMAIHTAFVLLLLSLAAALLNPGLGIARLFTGPGVGNKMARKHFITLMLVLIIFGSLRIQSERFHLLPPEIGISLLAISLLVTSLVMIWITANWLNKVDGQRSVAEEKIRNINTDLEIKVMERSVRLIELNTELQKSEERYRSLFEHASDAIYVLSNTGDFMEVNDSVCNMTGYSREELLQMNITSLLNAEILQNYPLIYKDIAPGKSTIAERKIIRKDGIVLDVEINIKKFVDKRILVISRDITQRKLMEAELRMAEVKFRTLAEKSMVGIYIVQHGRIVYVNPRFAEIFGYEPAELTGADPLATLIHPDYRQSVIGWISLRREEGIDSVHYETMGKRKDGSSNWIEFYGSRAFFEGEPTFVGSMIDITDRKKMETELRDAESKFRTMAEKSMVGVYIGQLDRFTYVNPRFAEIFGYEPEEITDMRGNISEMLFTKESSEAVMANVKARHSGEMESSHYEVTGIRKDGTTKFLEFYGNIVSIGGQPTIIGTMLDITERKKTETKLLEAELKFRTLVEKSIVGVYIAQNENFIYVNPKLAEIFGYTTSELLNLPGTPVDILFHADSRELIRANIAARYSGETEKVNYQVTGIRKDGTTNQVEIYSNVVTIDGKRCFIGTMLDITERKTMEKELSEAELKFRTVAEKSMLGVYVTQNKRFLYVNPRFAEIFGYTCQELMDLSEGIIDTIYTEESRAMVREKIRARDNGETEGAHYDAVGLKKDGSRIHVEFYGNRVTINGQPAAIGTALDITQRKKAEDELKVSEQKYKLLFESNPMPLWIVAKDDMTVIAANNAAAKLYGYTAEELLHMDIKKLRPVRFWPKLLERYHADLEHATDFGVIEHVKKDGTEIFVNIIAQDIVFEGRLARISSTSDVTERLRAEELLKTSEANLQTILSNTDTAYALLNADLDIVEYNNRALIMAKHEFNFAPEAGNKLHDTMPADRRQQFLEYTSQVFKGNTISYEVNYPQADDSLLWYYVRMFPIADKGNKILGLVLAINDITERKEAEDDLQTAYHSIESHINKIGEMTWKQSHLIRSPLANLKGLFPMLRSNPTDEEVLGFIEAELERMDEILLEMGEGPSIIEPGNTINQYKQVE